MRLRSLGKVAWIGMILPESGELTFSTCRLALMNVLRTLADVDNRGKLNIAEFHVAMGLIYRSM
jgi:hypothetical protein